MLSGETSNTYQKEINAKKRINQIIKGWMERKLAEKKPNVWLKPVNRERKENKNNVRQTKQTWITTERPVLDVSLWQKWLSICLSRYSFVLFCSVLLCFALFCFVLLCFALLCFAFFFCFALFCFSLLCFALLCFVLLWTGQMKALRFTLFIQTTVSMYCSHLVAPSLQKDVSVSTWLMSVLRDPLTLL